MGLSRDTSPWKWVCRATNRYRTLFFAINTPIFLPSSPHLSKMSSYRTNSDFSYVKARDALIFSENGLNFGAFSPLAGWCHRPVDFSFLLGALYFWSPADHLFRFGLDELCPTYEEFSWLLRSDVCLPMAVPIEEIGPRDMLIALLAIPQAACDGFISDGLLDLHKMVRFFHRYEDRASYGVGRTAAALICLVSDMLLVTGSSRVDPTILSLIYHARNGESIVPIVLAETLNGLDDIQRGASPFFRGSPRLLYMWLLERFRSVGFNGVRLDNLTHFFHRPLFGALTMSSSDWTVWFSENFRAIRWNIPWWKLRAMVLSTGGQNYVRLRGLWFTSFYLPGRLLRQFNVPQDIPLGLNNFSSESKFVTQHVSLSVERMWRARLTRQFNYARFGIPRPLRADIIRSCWQSLEGELTDDPFQMEWFRFMDSEPTEDGIVFAYQILDEARIDLAAEDPVWPTP
ncbi:hypothetical protein LguiA_007186 [Lonicera macranthoides]